MGILFHLSHWDELRCLR